MTRSTQAFLEGLIDYAGLFPPARLSMARAVETYARHLTSAHAWLVGRFVCPLVRLDELGAEGDILLRPMAPVRVAGLVSSVSQTKEMTAAAASDGMHVRRFEALGWGRVDVLEVRLPDDLFEGDAMERRSALTHFEIALKDAGMRLERIFYEITRDQRWSNRVTRCVETLAEAPHRGFKIRCGGVTPDAYPDPQEIAEAIGICSRAGVPFKATAGLHHPIRHARPEEGIDQHGFINVFAAGIVAQQVSSDDELLVRLLDDRNLGNFEFAEDNMAWSGHAIPVADIRSSRKNGAVSYGCCDIDEPVFDLTQAGLL